MIRTYVAKISCHHAIIWKECWKFQLYLFIKLHMRAFIFISFPPGLCFPSFVTEMMFFFMCSRYTEHCVPFTLSPHLLWIKLDQKEAGEWGQCTVSTPSENNGVWRNTVMNIVNCHTHKNSSKFSSTQPILQGCKNTFTHSANFITVQISNLPPNAYIIQGIIPFFFRSLVSQVQTDTVWIVPAKVDVKLSVTLIPSPVYRCSHVTTPLSFESSVVASLLH